ncbi:CLUMA_CG011085, isoform A [Clunio marinus]|uniref:CLUMA_CG011085, isoform A n=1 Tax=Clunio marinus TaxID=568069 RepID=A0A1J1IGZ3_9DIPT|nr:CLUMA_CG011085, isoform A [Clunio marinus]
MELKQMCVVYVIKLLLFLFVVEEFVAKFVIVKKSTKVKLVLNGVRLLTLCSWKKSTLIKKLFMSDGSVLKALKRFKYNS